MRKEAKAGLRGPMMPKEHFEKNEGEMGHECDLKYVHGEFSNPSELDKSTKGLADFVKKHQMKY